MVPSCSMMTCGFSLTDQWISSIDNAAPFPPLAERVLSLTAPWPNEAISPASCYLKDDSVCWFFYQLHPDQNR